VEANSFISSSKQRTQLNRWVIYLLGIFACVFAIDNVVFGLFTTRLHPLQIIFQERESVIRTILADRRDYDVIVLGSSMTNNGFNPSLFDQLTGRNSLNAGIAGHGSVDRCLRTIREILKTKTPKTVVYVIESFSLGIPPTPGPTVLEEAPKSEIVDLFRAHRNKEQFITWFTGLARRNVGTLPKFMPDPLAGHFTTFEGATLHSNGWVEVHGLANPDMPPANPDVPFRDDQITSLNDMLLLSRERGIELVLVQMPEYQTALKAFPERYRRFRLFMNEFASDNDLRYIDLSENAVFPYWDLSYFYDINHLNARGAELYTRILAQRLLAHWKSATKR
jgi:hypothetical protein